MFLFVMLDHGCFHEWEFFMPIRARKDLPVMSATSPVRLVFYFLFWPCIILFILLFNVLFNIVIN